MTYTTKIVNVETGEELERDMNAQEIKQLEADAALLAAHEAEKAAQADAKAALLDRLGITADEAALLLG